MTTETTPRLDVATLQHLIAWHEEESREFEPDGDAYLSHKASIEHLRELLAAAETAPPRLSDWCAACDDTGLGELQVIPSWELRAGSAGDFAHVDFIEAAGVADVVVTSYVKPTGQYDDGHRETRTRCATPAELRAALERLAGTSQPATR